MSSAGAPQLGPITGLPNAMASRKTIPKPSPFGLWSVDHCPRWQGKNLASAVYRCEFGVAYLAGEQNVFRDAQLPGQPLKSRPIVAVSNNQSR